MQAMRALLEQSQKRPKVENQILDEVVVTTDYTRKPTTEKNASTFSVHDGFMTTESISNLDDGLHPPISEIDVIDKGILTMEQATFLFQTYNEHLVYHYPSTIFPSSVTASVLRRTKPTLFLAVIAAASGKFSPTLYSILHTEVLNLYVRQTITNSVKSLELVQAMLITSSWYNPPDKYTHLKFYEYVHMAVTMAVDLGLGSNPKSSRSRRAEGGGTITSSLTEQDLENRRTFLICYIISAR